MSRLAQAGESKHRVAGRAQAAAARTAGFEGVAPYSISQAPSSAAPRLRASRRSAPPGAPCRASRCASGRKSCPLPSPAGDQHQRPGSPDTAARVAPTLVPFGVIDVADAGDVRHPGGAVRQTGELAQLGEQRAARQFGAPRQCESRQRIGRVVPAAELELGKGRAARRRA